MVELVDVVNSVVPLLSVVIVLGGMVVLGMFGIFVEENKVVDSY